METDATQPRIAHSRGRAHDAAVAGLTIALLSVSAWISIPLPFSPVPVTLQVMVVVFAALVFTPRQAFAGVGGYLLLGAIGVPVFHGFTAGLGILAGPTGGFLIGFLIGAVLGSFARRALAPIQQASPGDSRADLAADVIAALVVIASIYVVGWLQLAAVAGISLGKAFVVGVAPFVVIDLVKAGVAIVIARAVRRTGLV